MKNKILYYVTYWGTFLVVIGISRSYPAIAFQGLLSYGLYWGGKKMVKKFSASDPSKDASRKKHVYILSGLGLLGLFSPIIGYIFALPAYLIATELISPEFSEKKKLVSITAVVMAICILNAALGVIILHQPE